MSLIKLSFTMVLVAPCIVKCISKHTLIIGEENMSPDQHMDLSVICLNNYSIQPQSDKSEFRIEGGVRENDVLENNVVCDPAKTTCFVEDESIVHSRFTSSNLPSDIEIRYETIKDFLAKPYLLQSFQWTSATAENNALGTPFDIGPLLTTVLPWYDKIKGFELIRGTFNLRVQINASPFQQGRLLIHYLPNYRDRVAIDVQWPNLHNLELIQKFQQPHLELDCRDGVALMSIPYVAPSPYYDIRELTYGWGRVFIDVISPFNTGTAGIQNAEVTMFGYWSNVELAAPIVPQSSKKEKFVTKKGVSLEEQEKTQGPIASGLKTVSKAASTLSSIPILNAVMTPLSWAADVASQVASIFGWSKPRANDNLMVMTRQPLRYTGTGDGTDISFPTTLFAGNAIETTDKFSITSEDEMSMRFLLSIPTYLSATPGNTGRITWTTAQATNTSLLTRDLIPANFRNQHTQSVGLLNHVYRLGAPLYYLSNFFSFYRGSINLHIKLVKTIFHSGKLLITYSPVQTMAVTPDNTTSIYSLREIIDIREQSEITLNLPYMLHRPYQEVDTSMGTLNIRVLNDLRCPETVAQSVDLLVFWTAGEDFEYQVPSSASDGANVYVPQSDNIETLIKSGIAESKIISASTIFSSYSIGEHFASIKQLLNRDSQLQSITGNAFAVPQISVAPWMGAGVTATPVVGTLRTTGFNGDAFSILAPMYNYFRGKARVALHYDTTNNDALFNVPRGFRGITTLIQTNVLSFGNNTPVLATPSLSHLPFQTPVMSSLEQGYAYMQVPYYCQFPASFTHVMTGGTTLFYNDETHPISTANFSSNSAFGGGTTIRRSYCDDFQLSFFIGCPPWYVSTS